MAAAMHIEGELTIYRAAELRAGLLAALAGLAEQPAGAELQIDLAGVNEMDSAGVQLLMAAQKSAQAGQYKLRLVEPSAAVLEVFKTLDLAGHFDITPTTTRAPA